MVNGLTALDMTEEEIKKPNTLEDWKAAYIKMYGEPFCDNDEDWQELFEETHFKQRHEARGQFIATQEFMETPMYHSLSPSGKKFWQNEHDRLERMAYCECDPDGYGDKCYTCLQVYRRARYGWDIHNTDCVCNQCTYGDANPFRGDY